MNNISALMDIRTFQNRYKLQNRDMARLCGCSVPTIQKWRSGQVSMSGAARQLLKFLDANAGGDPAALRELAQKVESGEGSAQEAPLVPARLRTLESNMNHVVDRLELMLESRRKQRELQESTERYRTIVEAQDDPVCRWLPDTTLTYANSAYCLLFGVDPQAIKGKKWINFVPENQRGDVLTLVSDVIRRGEAESFRHRVVDGKGCHRLFQWKDIPIKNERGEVLELHSLGRDITQEEETRRQLKEKEAILRGFFSMGNQYLAILDEEGQILQRNDLFQRELGEEKKVKELANLCDHFPRRRFAKLLRKLGPGDELVYRLPGKVSVLHLRLRPVGGTEGHRRFLATIERGHQLENEPRTLQARFAQEIGLVHGEVPLLFPSDKQDHLQNIMTHLGLEAGVARAYVFIFDHEGDYCDNTMEWCAPGVEPQLDHLRRVPTADYPWWVERIRGGHWIQVEDISKLPRTAIRERTVLEAQDIRAVLAAPLFVENRCFGWVGFEEIKSTRIWHGQDTELLTKLKTAFEEALRPAVRDRAPRD
jgi:PAS domain S-box-containing protein